jgi:hypothetical protein
VLFDGGEGRERKEGVSALFTKKNSLRSSLKILT